MLFVIGLALAVGKPAAHSAPAPNFSGKWALASVTPSGAGSHTSGAAFNCGRSCTITHQGQNLKVESALLASAAGPAPAVTFQLDGREVPVPNSSGRGGQLPAVARWDGDTVEIVTKADPFPMGYKQTLVLDGAQLVVVTADDQGKSSVKLKYSRK
jgi:hypothetical protein